MRKLNLADPERSDIGFKVSKFPDGQQQVLITEEDFLADAPVQIKSRLNNFKDLELIVCSVASLRGLGVKQINLYVFCASKKKQD